MIGAKKVKDYKAVLMQIGLLYYPEPPHFPRRSYTFLILQGCFPPSVLSAILARGSVCLILIVCVTPLLYTITLFGLERGFVLVQSGYFIVKCISLGRCACRGVLHRHMQLVWNRFCDTEGWLLSHIKT